MSEKARRSHITLLLLSTDTEKAFDRVDWVFLQEMLLTVRMPKSVLDWISALYTNPTARVNGLDSDMFAISNSPRQGCPLSPLLFVLSLEPFLGHIKDNLNINGVQSDTK